VTIGISGVIGALKMPPTQQPRANSPLKHWQYQACFTGAIEWQLTHKLPPLYIQAPDSRFWPFAEGGANKKRTPTSINEQLVNNQFPYPDRLDLSQPT
jgi:hypothetical protein